jgi:hypothetical protein
MAFKISFVSDVREVLRGNEAMEKGFNDTASSLDDVARDARKAGDNIEKSLDSAGDAAKDAGNKIERELSDSTKSAGQDADRLEKKFREAFDEVKTQSKKTGDGLGDNVKKGAKEADEGLDTMSENAGSNAKEIAASFDGSFDSMADGLQGFIAESLEGFGAIGLAGGVGIALAIGIGLNALNEMAEEANALTEDAVELGDALASATSVEDKVQVLSDRFSEVADEIGDARSAWEIWQDRARTKGEQFADAIKQGSLSAQALTDAFENPDPVRRLEDLRKVSDDLQKSIDRVADAQDEAAQTAWRQESGSRALSHSLLEQIDVSKAAKDIIDDEIATQEASNAILEAKATALGLTTEEYIKQQSAAEKATAVQEAYASALEAAADPVQVYTDALGEATEATSQTVQDMIDTWNRQAEEAEKFEGNLAVIAASGGDALAAELRAKGPEAAAATADLIAKSGDAKIRESAAAYGRANGSAIGTGTADGITSQAGAVQGAVDAVGRGIRTPSLNYPVHVDQAQAQAEVDRVARSLRAPTVGFSMSPTQQRPV